MSLHKISEKTTIFSYFYIQPKEINEICKYEICKYEYKYIYIIVVENKRLFVNSWEKTVTELCILTCN